MSSAWQRLAEERINEAIERGEFADVPNGRALDLEAYFRLPEHERAGLTLLRDAGVVPAEVTLLKEIETLQRALEACADERRRGEFREQLQTRQVSFAMAMERRRGSSRGREG